MASAGVELVSYDYEANTPLDKAQIEFILADNLGRNVQNWMRHLVLFYFYN